MARKLRTWRRLIVLSVAMLGLSGLVTISATSASAATLETFQNEATHYCLATFIEGGPTEDVPPCGASGTIDWWRVTDLNNGYVLLESDTYPGQCLTDDGYYDGNGGQLPKFYPCDAAAWNQDWLPVGIPGGYVILGNRAWGLCLDDSITYHLRDFDCNNLPYQNWY